MARRKDRYSWRKDMRLHAKANAQHVGEWLEDIKATNGDKLEAEHIVEAARKRGSPARVLFEWDDTAAAHNHRLEQARLMMRSLCVVYASSKSTEPIKAFVHVISERSAGYMGMFDALSDEEARTYVLQKAKAELMSFRQRYRDLQELAAVIKVIDVVLA